MRYATFFVNEKILSWHTTCIQLSRVRQIRCKWFKINAINSLWSCHGVCYQPKTPLRTTWSWETTCWSSFVKACRPSLQTSCTSASRLTWSKKHKTSWKLTRCCMRPQPMICWWFVCAKTPKYLLCSHYKSEKVIKYSFKKSVPHV